MLAPTPTSPEARPLSLDWLLAPVGGERFRSDYWERDYLYIERDDPSFYADVFSFAEVDRALYTARQSAGEPVTVIPPHGSGGKQQRLRPHRVPMSMYYNFFGRGETIRLSGVQDFSPSVAHLVAALQGDLDARVNVNFYLTGQGSQGFPIHYDTHDVFILQVDGAKHWSVYGRYENLPIGSLEYPRHLGRSFKTRMPEEDAELREEIHLRAGDLLYLPRGFPHKAVATDEPSLHLTFGLHPLYWVDALKAAVDLVARERPELRAALPQNVFAPGATGEELAGNLRKLLAVVSEETDLGDVGRALAGKHHESLFEPPDGHVSELVAMGEITADTELERRDGLSCRVTTAGGQARIDFGPNHVSGPAALAPAFELVATTRRFRVRDLPGLSESSSLVIAKRLVHEGLVRRA